MVWNSCRKRRSARNRRGASLAAAPHHHPSSDTCWRNPIVVFVVTFAVLGTLQFRPRKSKSSINSNPQRNRLAINFPNPRRSSNRDSPPAVDFMAKTNPTTITSSAPARITYRLVEEGKYQSRTSFRRYAAVAAVNNTASSSSSDPTSSSHNQFEPVSFSQWAQGLAIPDNALELSAVLRRGVTPNSKDFDNNDKDGDAAVFWETPPVLRNVDRPMEFVLMDSPRLKAFATTGADESAFAAHFAACAATGATVPEEGVKPTTVKAETGGCVFDSLGRDAVLVAPLPHRGTNAAHLASFVRTAPSNQQAAFWKLVGATWLHRVEHQSPHDPLWLSTSGLGVAYLHVRLDTRPKYYTYDPYKNVPTNEQLANGATDNRSQSS